MVAEPRAQLGREAAGAKCSAEPAAVTLAYCVLARSGGKPGWAVGIHANSDSDAACGLTPLAGNTRRWPLVCLHGAASGQDDPEDRNHQRIGGNHDAHRNQEGTQYLGPQFGANGVDAGQQLGLDGIDAGL